MSYSPTGGKTYTLASSISSTQTTILLSSFLEPVTGTPYTMAYLNTDIVYATIAPKTTQTEFISFTGITQNTDGTATLTGVTRGLSRSYPFTSSSAYKLSHGGQTNLVLSNSPQQINEYGALRDDQAITGYWTAPDPIAPLGVANREWVLSVVNGGPISVDAIIVSGTAGETISIGTPIYYKVADGRWWKAIGTTSSTINQVQLGIAQGAGTAGNAVTGGVLLRGFDTHQTGGTAGLLGYISDTSTIATTTGTSQKVVGQFASATTFYFNPDFYYTVTAAQQTAINSITFNVQTATASTSFFGDATTQFDITNPVGTTFRYTFDGTGTDPNINSGTVPIGSTIDIEAQNFASGNKGIYITTGVGANYFEISNASGVAESNKTIGTGFLVLGTTWTKPVGATYARIIVIGGGGGGRGGSGIGGGVAGTGGGGGGYSIVEMPQSALASSVYMLAGAKGNGGGGATSASGPGSNGVTGGTSFFGTYVKATGGGGGTATAGAAGVGTISGGAGGAITTAGASSNLAGGGGGGGTTGNNGSQRGGTGGAVLVPTRAGGLGGLGNGDAGSNGISAASLEPTGGSGGGGGGGNNSSATGGGAGGSYGGGGAGGGTAFSADGQGGNGGDGAPGIIVVISY